MAIGDVLARYPQVQPEELEITTEGRRGGIYVRVKHLPSTAFLEASGLNPDNFDAGLRKLVESLLQQVTSAK